MSMKQLSVFLENREGRIERVTEILKKAEINIISFSLADTSEYGVLRLLVSDPKRAKEYLKEEEFSAILTDVTVVCLPNEPGKLHELLLLLLQDGLSIEYMYGASNNDQPAVVLKVRENEEAEKILEHAGYSLCE
ncbi:amino acid-binding ACT [Lachnospiraceae bacterium KM106-2]|nr:amino acid-binding ACT [Lachnospiraceae bacterium KM106-2]